jgi:non-ribosomal peptide synthetase component E (peptide arylation enzyme)
MTLPLKSNVLGLEFGSSSLCYFGMLYRRLFCLAKFRGKSEVVRFRSNLSYVHAASTIPLSHETIHERMRRTVELCPDKEFLVFSQQNIRKTYVQVYEDALNLAKGLLSLGLGKGDRIGIWGNNFYEWTVTQFAAAASGLILVNLSPAYQADELKFALQKVGVKALVTPQCYRHSNYYE